MCKPVLTHKYRQVGRAHKASTLFSANRATGEHLFGTKLDVVTPCKWGYFIEKWARRREQKGAIPSSSYAHGMFEMHVSDGLNQYEEDREGNSMEVYSKEFTSMLFFFMPNSRIDAWKTQNIEVFFGSGNYPTLSWFSPLLWIGNGIFCCSHS